MPVYTYRCDNCGHQFEKHQSFQDEPLKTCPNCRKRKLKKVITPTKVIFKGSGFYATDHRSSSGNDSKPAKDDKKENKKEDAKPADTKSTEKKSEK